MKKLYWKLPLWIVGGLLALILVVFVALQVILSPRVCQRLVDKYVPELTDGHVIVRGVSVSMFAHFPRMTAYADSIMLVYPRDTVTMEKDTIAMALEFSAAINPVLHYVKASTLVTTEYEGLGHVELPVELNGKAYIQSDSLSNMVVLVKDADLDVAELCLQADMDVTLGDQIGLRGNARIPDLELQTLIDKYAEKLVPELKKVEMDAKFSARADVDGYYDPATGELPAFTAHLDIPRCNVSHSDYSLCPTFELAVGASAPQGGVVDVDLEEFCVMAPGLDFDINGSVNDLLGDDALIGVDARLEVALDSLGAFLAENFDLYTGGNIHGTAKGKFRLSQLDMYNFSKADLRARIDAEKVRLSSFDDSLNVFVDSLQIRTGLMDNRFAKNVAKDAKKSLGASVTVDSLSVDYAGVGYVRARQVTAFAQGSTTQVVLSDTVKYNPLFVKLTLGDVSVKDEDSLRVHLSGSENRISMRPSSRNDKIPSINISSHNKRLRAADGVHRFMLSDLDFDANAVMAVEKRKKRVRTYLDSVARLHPEWSRDSVRRYLQANARDRKLPEWMREEDFRKADIHIDLGESLRKYYEKWNLSGTLSLRSARMATPAFPLRTRITDFHGSFDNDRIVLDTLRVVAGASDFAANGKVSNLRRAVLNKGTIRLDLGLNTDTLSVTELLAAYALGSRNMEKLDSKSMGDLSDAQIEAMTESMAEEVEADTSSVLIIPANVNAEVRLRGKGVSYSNLDMKSLSADLTVKERCMLLKDVRAITTMGDIYADAFYSTKTKNTLVTGFDVTFKDIAAADVIGLMPQLDTLMPILKTFDGRLNCNMAATARLDTCMNIQTKSLRGIVRITGRDLHFTDNKDITRLARLLWVRNPKRVTVDSMAVEGLISNNKMEIFPFVMKVDKWAIAMAGIQRLDESFNYHVSVARSPWGIKLGANIDGPDFDNINFHLGRAVYRHPKDVPSFTHVIDTTRLNLRSSILRIFEQGVDKALQESENQSLFQKIREKMNYSHSVALDSLEKVSAAELKAMEALGDKFDEEGEEKKEENEGAEPSGDVPVLDEGGNLPVAMYGSAKGLALPPRRFAYNVTSLVDKG